MPGVALSNETNTPSSSRKGELASTDADTCCLSFKSFISDWYSRISPFIILLYF